MEYGRPVWREIHVGDVNLEAVDDQVTRTPRALLIGAKDIYDAVKRSNSAVLSMNDKRSAVEGVAPKESFEGNRTRMKWLHSDVNVNDALTTFDQRATANSATWSIVFRHTFFPWVSGGLLPGGKRKAMSNEARRERASNQLC